MQTFLPIEKIDRLILFIRGKKVMLDRDLAILYGVKPTALRQQVKRNLNRFPEDFMFQLTTIEVEAMVSQFVIPSRKVLGGHLPYAFTEQGVAMLSSVLKSDRDVEIIRAFVRLRQLLSTNKELVLKLESLETKYDSHFKVVFDAIRQLMAPPLLTEDNNKAEKIGFKVTEDRLE